MATGIFVGSSTGNTQDVAEKIKDALGDAEILEIGSSSASDLEKYDNIFLGSSTWGSGDLQDDWEEIIDEISKLDLSGKKVAIFGTGDQESYADTFVDAIGTIYEAVKDTGATILGKTSTDGYTFDSSKAVVDGKFVGLPLDQDNQEDMTEDRINAWTEQLSKL